MPWLYQLLIFGAFAGYCPDTHRYAYLNGDFCCFFNREADNETPGCQNLQLSEASNCCKQDKFIKCEYPPCINSFMDEVEKGADAVTFLRKKGIFINHEVKKKFALIKQRFPITLSIGFPYPKIDRVVHFGEECPGLTKLSFNFNTILKRLIKQSLQNNANRTTLFHYEDNTSHEEHADLPVDLTGHVIIHDVDGKIIDSHPGDVPLSPPTGKWDPDRNNDQPASNPVNPDDSSSDSWTTDIIKDGSGIEQTESTTVRIPFKSPNGNQALRAHYRVMNPPDITNIAGPGTAIETNKTIIQLYEEILQKRYTITATPDINWEQMFNRTEDKENCERQQYGQALPCNNFKDDDEFFELLITTNSNGNIWMEIGVSMEQNNSAVLLAKDLNMYTITFSNKDMTMKNVSQCELAKAELNEMAEKRTYLQLSYNCKTTKNGHFFVQEKTMILIKMKIRTERCPKIRIHGIFAKGLFLEKPSRKKRQALIAAGVTAGVTLLASEVYTLFHQHTQDGQITEITQKINHNELENQNFHQLFLDEEKHIHLLMNKTQQVLTSINKRICSLLQLSDYTQAELVTSTIASTFVNVLTHQVVWYRMGSSNIRKLSMELCVKNYFETPENRNTEATDVEQICNEYYEMYKDAIEIKSLNLENYGPAINIKVDIPDFTLQPAKIFKIEQIPIPVGRLEKLFTFMQFNAMPSHAVHLLSINQTLAADSIDNQCKMSETVFFCDSRILFLYDDKSTCAGSLFDPKQFRSCSAKLITSIDSCAIRPVANGILVSNVVPIGINYGDRNPNLPVHYVHSTKSMLPAGTHFLGKPRAGSILCERTSFYFNKLMFTRPSVNINISIDTSNSLHLDSDIFSQLNSLMTAENITDMLSNMHQESNFPFKSMQEFLNNNSPTFPLISHKNISQIKSYTIMGLSIALTVIFLILLIFCVLKIRRRFQSSDQHAEFSAGQHVRTN
mgnify:CR=1 FL=1